MHLKSGKIDKDFAFQLNICDKSTPLKAKPQTPIHQPKAIAMQWLLHVAKNLDTQQLDSSEC